MSGGPVTEPQVLDEARMRELQELLPDDFGSLLDGFNRDGESHLLKVAECVRYKDWDGAARTLHTLKGAAINIGGEQLAALCEQCRPLLNDTQWQAQYLHQLQQSYARLRVRLERWHG